MAYKLSQSSASSSTRYTIAADGRKIAKLRINRKKYGSLLAEALPRVIETPRELERLTGQIEPLLDKGERRTAEEEELCRLVLKLIDDYQRERQLIPALKPHELLQTLLEESGKRQVDLMPVFGSRSRVSDAVNGKREISKAQAKRLGQLFHLSPAAFI
jgi:HTH-type transcriptional regulator/antitoxin HigA